MQPKPIRAVYNTPMRRFLLLCSWLTNEFAKFTNRQNQSVRYAFYYVYVCPTSAHRGFRYGYRLYKDNTFYLENHLVWQEKYDFKVWFNIIKYKYVKEFHFCVIFLAEKFVLSMIICIFATTESATLPIWTANQGGSFAFMGTLRLYTKQALSISEQIELLKSRGLNIADSSKAAKFLGEVSYFRFVQYLRPMEADKTTHQFKPNSRFEDAVALYNFDIP